MSLLFPENARVNIARLGLPNKNKNAVTKEYKNKNADFWGVYSIEGSKEAAQVALLVSIPVACYDLIIF